jgi:hypothetical protein
MRFIKTTKTDKDPVAYKKYPGTFFIFADMSIRKAGQYRLFFRLMKMEEPVKRGTGAVVPAISTAMSDIFNVVNAKDFDQVQPSTKLIRGLVERGAGYPLKLKKGFREGQRRRIRAGESYTNKLFNRLRAALNALSSITSSAIACLHLSVSQYLI